MATRDIKELRTQIDDIDSKILALFEERMGVVAEVAEYKRENNFSIRDNARERELLVKAACKVDKELFSYAKMLYSTMLNISRAYQSEIIWSSSRLSEEVSEALETTPKIFPEVANVACQGVEGAYSQLAADKMFSSANIMYFKTFEGVFKALENDMCEYGVLPLENNTAGSVTQVYDLLAKYGYYIVRSTSLQVQHALLGKKNTKISNIKELYSHDMAIMQCGKFISTLKDAKTVPCLNTAIAAESVAKSERDDIAAIASPDCAGIYGLSVLSYNIQNSDNNHTRFICISKKLKVFPGADKTSIILTLPHRPGALYDVLGKIQTYGLNITKLESRPIPGRDFDFRFYFDIAGSLYSPSLMQLLYDLENEVESFQYLGTYSEKA